MDNRERARAHSPNYLEACRLMPGAVIFGVPDEVELTKLRRAIEAALDAAESRGRPIADDATVGRVAQASYEERIRQQFRCEPGAAFHPRLGQRTLAWAELPESSKTIEHIIARAALAAIPAPPARESDTK